MSAHERHRDTNRELVERYLLDILSEEECRAFEERLRDDGDLVQELARAARHDTAVRGALKVLGKDTAEAPAGAATRGAGARGRAARRGAARRGAPRRMNGRRAGRPVAPARVRWGRWISVAACLAIIVGTYLANMRQADRMAEVIVGTIAESGGNVHVVRSGNRITAFIGMEIVPNDIVRTGSNSRVTMGYRDEHSAVRLLGDTRARFYDTQGAKRLDIDGGTVECDIARQPEGKPMVLATPHAKARVKGTGFSLAVTGKGTRLDVFEGLVGFTRIADGESIDVAAGQYAVAAEGVNLVAMAIEDEARATWQGVKAPVSTGPVGDEWERDDYDLGPVVLSNPFEKGLGGWEILTGPDVFHLEPVGEDAAREIVKVGEGKVGGQFQEFLGTGVLPGMLRITFKPGHEKAIFERDMTEESVICLRMRRPLAEEAFSMKVFCDGAAQATFESAFPWATVHGETEHVRRFMYPAQHMLRLDYTPAGTGPDGASRWEERVYMKDLKYGPDRVQGLMKTRIISTDDTRIGIAFGRCNIRILGIEIRRMVEK